MKPTVRGSEFSDHPGVADEAIDHTFGKQDRWETIGFRLVFDGEKRKAEGGRTVGFRLARRSA